MPWPTGRRSGCGPRIRCRPARRARDGLGDGRAGRRARLRRTGFRRRATRRPALRRGAPLGVASAFSPGDERVRPNRIHGRVFATSPADGDFACSGTAVNSPGRSLVVTAGHCVYLSGEWADELHVRPRLSRRPLALRALGRRRSCGRRRSGSSAENISFDIGDGHGEPQPLRTRGCRTWSAPAGSASTSPATRSTPSYGYPAEPPFDGESPAGMPVPVPGRRPLDRPAAHDADRLRHERRRERRRLGRRGTRSLSVNSYCTGLVLVCLDVPRASTAPTSADEAQEPLPAGSRQGEPLRRASR